MNHTNINSLTPKTGSFLKALESVEQTGWVGYKYLRVNAPAFRAGILLIADNKDMTQFAGQQQGSNWHIKFKVGSRNYELYPQDRIDPKHLPLTEHLRSLTNRSDKSVSRVANKTFLPAIYNANRRDEIFYPLTFTYVANNSSSSTTSAPTVKHAFYVYPWLSASAKSKKSSSPVSSKGFDTFVTATCMFGGHITGIDSTCQTSRQLIKHDAAYHEGEKIDTILIPERADDANFEKTLGPYEITAFIEFEETAQCVKQLADPAKKPLLYCHLPYYDYILFGIKLFIQGRITVDALNDFFKYILERKDQYIEKMTTTCRAHGVDLKAETPFKNLDKQLNMQKVDEGKYAATILSNFGISCDEVAPGKDLEAKKNNEKAFVDRLITLLQTSTTDSAHQQIWVDMFQAIKNSGQSQKKLETDIKNNERIKSNKQEEIKRLSEQIKASQSDNGGVDDEIKELRVKLESSGKKLKELKELMKKKITTPESTIEQLGLNKKLDDDEIRNLVENMDESRKKVADLVKQKQKTKEQEKLDSLTKEVEKIDAELARQRSQQKKKAGNQITMPTTIEELFKYSNPLMIALATGRDKEKAAYHACAIETASEKQIQISFAEINPELQYHDVFNITRPDNGNHYDAANCRGKNVKPGTQRDNSSSSITGLSFYSTQNQQELSELLDPSGLNLLGRANCNAATFAEKSAAATSSALNTPAAALPSQQQAAFSPRTGLFNNNGSTSTSTTTLANICPGSPGYTSSRPKTGSSDSTNVSSAALTNLSIFASSTLTPGTSPNQLDNTTRQERSVITTTATAGTTTF